MMGEFDSSYLHTLTAKSQMVVLVLQVVVALVTGLAPTCGPSTIRNIFDCPISDFYFIVSFNTSLTMSFLLIAYSYHWVELTTGFQWLAFEYISSATLGVLNFILSLVILKYENMYRWATTFGLISTVPLFLLAVVKYHKYRNKEPAQQMLFDPDEDASRVSQLNHQHRQHANIVSQNESHLIIEGR